MDFTFFYNSVSDSEKLKYLEALLKSNVKLQQDFKSKVSIAPNPQTAEINNNQTFAELVEEFKNKFEINFSSLDVDDFDWEDVHIPNDYYVEEWELIDDYFIGQVSDLFIPVKDLFLEKLIENKFSELLAAFYALYYVSQNLDIEEGDYCNADTVRDSFLNNCFEITKLILEKIKNISKFDSNTNESLIMFFDYFFLDSLEDENFEKNIESLLYEMIIKLDDNSKLFNLFQKYRFEHFHRISTHLMETNSNEESWMEYAYKHYQNDVMIAEKLLLKLHKTNTEKFISVAFTIINDPTNYKEEESYSYQLDDMYYGNSTWNVFLCPLVNYQEHKSLFIAVNLNLVNSKNNIDYYVKVRDYLSLEQKQKFIHVLWSTQLKIKVYIIENEKDKAKELIEENTSLSQLKELLEPFTDIEPEYIYNYILSFINDQIKTARGRDEYSLIADLLNFAISLNVCGGKTYDFALALCNRNKRLIALKDELRKAGLI
jgi:hypothetical protein